MIVKLQLPIGGNAPEPLAMVYTRDRNYEEMIPVTPELAAMVGERAKSFWEAMSTGTGILFGAEVEDPGW